MIFRIFANPQFLAIYIVASLIIGVIASNRRLGFWGGFFLSLLLTPLIMYLVIYISGVREQFQKK
jgi:biotin transporter BioY